jgi:ABC-type uncharacterized transport system permease subunit
VTLPRLIKRTGVSVGKTLLIRSLSIIGALIATAIFISIMGHNPFEVYKSMLDGAFGSLYRFKETIIKAIPLIITSLGIAVAFKMKFWNIGAEGQILIGALAASFFALYVNNLPMPLMLIVMVIASIIGGGIWALIPAFFKAQFGTNETLFTLMMNYIALKIVVYLQYGPWKDPAANGFPTIANFPENAELPKLMGINIGWMIAVVLVIIMYIFLKHSKMGYEISVLGESENTARYAGMNIKKIIISTMLISGGLAGLTGMIQASGVSNTLSENLTGGVGYTAIITTWLGGLNPLLMLLVSFLFAALEQGGAYIQSAFQIPKTAAMFIQGTILFFVLGGEFFIQYKMIFDHFLFIKKERAK